MSMNKLPPLPLIDGCLFMDNSAWFEGFSSCYRYLQYKSLNERIHAGESAALNFGGGTHLGAELRYARYQNKPIDDDFYEMVGGVYTRHFADHPIPAGDWRSLNWAMELIRKYNERYPTEPFGLLEYKEPIACPVCEGKRSISVELVDEPSYIFPCVFCAATGTRSVMVELPFALLLFVWEGEIDPGDEKGKRFMRIPIYYTGRIDLPISENGSIFVMDHKTTSYLGDMFWNEQRMASQHRGYVWAFKQLTGQDVKGYVVNAIRSKEPPQYVTNGGVSKTGKKQNPQEWWNESFDRQRFLTSDAQLREWHHNAIDLVEEFFFHYQRDYMPMKTKWCAQYGKCPYYAVCSMHVDDRDMMLMSGEFKNNEWSPLKQPTQGKV